MTCPYCAAFGRDLFGPAPPSPRAAVARERSRRRAPPRGAGGRPAGGPAARRDEDEPSWPVGFDGPAGAGNRVGGGAARTARAGRR